MMDFTVIIEAITKHISLPVLVACLGIGYVIKHSMDFIPNKYIPVILFVLGLVLNMVINGFAVEIAIYGAATGLVSVGMHQAFKQFVEGKNEQKEETTE